MAINPKNKEEKEKKSQVLMQAHDLLESRNEIIKAFKNVIFLSEHLKKSDNAYNYMLRNVNEFIEEIKSMEKITALSLFEDFFQWSSPANYANMLINTKNQNENKERLKEIENRIWDLKDRIAKMSDKERKTKNADETLEIIEKILDYNKCAQNLFYRASSVDKKKIRTKDWRKHIRKIRTTIWSINS